MKCSNIIFLPVEGDQYFYNIEDPHSLNYLDNAHLELFRAKRDVNIQPQQQPSQPLSQPVAPTSAASSVPTTNTSAIDKIAEIPKVENGPRLLGVNGTGQRKDVTVSGGIKVTDSGPSKPAISDSKSASINTSLGAVQSMKPVLEQPVPDDEEKLIDEIDEPEEAINKTVDDHVMNQLTKTDYFQYYNSTLIVDKNKSDEYWSVKKNYTVSGILSKSHRRAIVSISIYIVIKMCVDFDLY